MAGRTHIGTGDDKGKSSTRVESQLEKLKPQAFDALGAGARNELIRETLVLILRILARRVLK